jgi:GNAT superfamily N-acetyltransferase
MSNEAGFDLDGPEDHRVVRLGLDEAEWLQGLYEACAEFSVLVDGEPPAPTAAADDLTALPPGSQAADKFVFGLVDAAGGLVGMIESIRAYPDDKAWWLGLLMIHPAHRRDGLGSVLYSGFERWVAAQGFTTVGLGVVSANLTGLAFWQRLGFAITRTVPEQQFGRLVHDLHVLEKSAG